VLADADFVNGRYWLLLASDAGHALQIDMRGLAPWSEWPMQAQTSPVRVALVSAGQHFVLQAGRSDGAAWRFDFSKHLATDSQPFDVVAEVQVGWSQLPWGWMLAWVALVTVLLTGLRVSRQQHQARRRAEALQRLGKIARLNALGERATGTAHEVNQPLAAVLVNTQAAKRLLADTPPDIVTAQSAMADAAQQAQRAAEVVGRLRRSVDSPDAAAEVKAVDLHAALHGALYLLAPQLQQYGVAPAVQVAAAVHVQADPLELANQSAATAVASCAANNSAVTATVVDRAGSIRAVQRADNAGPHTLGASLQKAYTSASAKNNTQAMMEASQKIPQRPTWCIFPVTYCWAAACRCAWVTK
jgi:signal transduction histidine kinase